jgi:hypothetical protein
VSLHSNLDNGHDCSSLLSIDLLTVILWQELRDGISIPMSGQNRLSWKTLASGQNAVSPARALDTALAYVHGSSSSFPEIAALWSTTDTDIRRVPAIGCAGSGKRRGTGKEGATSVFGRF